MYNCLHHVKSAGKAASLRDVSSDTAFPTDETRYKQPYIHFLYTIRLSNIFMIKHKKKHVSFIEFNMRQAQPV